jgi:vacuolar-type H+-ATPase subunit E/Vma4
VGNQSIYDKILQKGREDSSQLLENGKNRAKMIVEATIQEVNKTLSIERAKRQSQLEEAYKTKMTQFEQAMKQESLFNKKQLLKQVFDQTLLELTERKGEELQNFVVETLKKDRLSGSLTIKVNKRDYSLYLASFSSSGDGTLDRLTSEIGDSLTLVLSHEFAPIKGGFLVIGDEFDIDHSYDAIMHHLMETMESRIATLLFNEESE